jgi:hypothetical protein
MISPGDDRPSAGLRAGHAAERRSANLTGAVMSKRLDQFLRVLFHRVETDEPRFLGLVR